MNEKNKSLFENVEAQGLFHEHYNNLVKESDRGAVIVGADILDSHIRRLLNSKFIDDFSNHKRKDLFDFSGALGSLSSKINIAYAFGFIDETTRNAARSLKTIRNLAAHSNPDFSLKENSELIRKVYEIGNGVPEAVKDIAIKTLINDVVNCGLEIEFEDKRKAFETPLDVLDHLADNPLILESADEKIFRMEFGIGLILLCALIIHQTVEKE